MERPTWLRLYRPKFVRRPVFWPVLVIWTWGFLWSPGGRQHLGTFGLWTYIIVSTFLVVSLLARTPRQPTTTTLLLLDLLVTLTTVIGNFAYMYWNAGTAHNFTQPLTKLDAVYFSVGTLSTAGTGTISATSQVARGMQLAEICLGMALVLFGVGVVLVRFMGVMATPVEPKAGEPKPKPSGRRRTRKKH
jgi:hypothetical protein